MERILSREIKRETGRNELCQKVTDTLGGKCGHHRERPSISRKDVKFVIFAYDWTDKSGSDQSGFFLWSRAAEDESAATYDLAFPFSSRSYVGQVKTDQLEIAKPSGSEAKDKSFMKVVKSFLSRENLTFCSFTLFAAKEIGGQAYIQKRCSSGQWAKIIVAVSFTHKGQRHFAIWYGPK